MKIVKASKDGIFPLLTKREAAFVTAAYAEKLASMATDIAEKELLKIVNRAYAELQRYPPGLSATERERFMKSFVTWIILDCNNYFPDVTMAEISTAIGRGLRGEFGEYMGFNNIVIHGFINTYLESEERTSALAKQHRFLLLQEVAEVFPLDDKWSIMKEGIYNCYNNYKKTHRILDLGSINFEILEKAGAINLSLEEKKIIYEVAKNLVLKEQESQVTTYRMAIEFKRRNDSNDWPIKSKAREIALKNFYDSNPDLDSWMDKLYEAFLTMEPDNRPIEPLS
jgi:hypothetical protein